MELLNRLLFDTNLKYRIARHFLFVMVIVLTFAIILYLQNSNEEFLKKFRVTFTNSIFFLGYAYITLFLLIPEFLLKNRVIGFVLVFLLVGIGLSALKLVFSDVIFYSSISPGRFDTGGLMNLRFILVNTKDMTFIVALLSVTKYAKDYIYTEQIRKKLVRQSREAQRRLLQSQLNPHFLFNTINNLYALSLLNPGKTTEIIERLQIVLGYIVEQSQHDFVNLGDEYYLVENYILLEKIRYGDRLKIEMKKTGNLRNWKVPPMVFFFLAENCFKHGSSLDEKEPWIKLDVKASEKQVAFIAANSKPKTIKNNAERKKEGQGLVNLQKRLDILYPKKGYSVKIDDESGIYRVKIELIKATDEVGRKTYR